MKRLLSVLFLMATVMLLGSQYNRAEAVDFYLGNYSDGTTAYLMTDSIKESVYDRDEGGEQYNCWVKIVDPNADDYDTTRYTITYYQVLGMKRDGKYLYTLRTMADFFASHPVERNLVEYINRHYRDPYGKSR